MYPASSFQDIIRYSRPLGEHKYILYKGFWELTSEQVSEQKSPTWNAKFHKDCRIQVVSLSGSRSRFQDPDPGIRSLLPGIT